MYCTNCGAIVTGWPTVTEVERSCIDSVVLSGAVAGRGVEGSVPAYIHLRPLTRADFCFIGQSVKIIKLLTNI